MPNPTLSTPTLPLSATTAAEQHLLDHQLSIWKQTDRMMAGLLMFEWIGAIMLAMWRAPHTYNSAISSIHPHLWAAVFLGGATISLPIALVLTRPGQMMTRHTVALAQMLIAALLIHIGDGRIEMHFHIFGSLAFLAFYRDWRVLISATSVVVMDHLVLGYYLPESIYGVASATIWRTVEHAGWVVFEDIFLIGSCIQAVREMRGIATNRALLEQSYQDVERKVDERTTQLKSAQQDLMKAARSAGMAEIATSVLHNVGNVLNSVNVSATVVTDKLRQSEIASLSKVSQMMSEHQSDMVGFLTQDERGKMIPEFITELAGCLNEEQTAMLAEIETLSHGIDHIKRIVAAQQSMAKTSHVASRTKLSALLDSAINMASPSTAVEVAVQRNCVDGPEVVLDQHKVLQILINLLSNARHAVMYRAEGLRHVKLTAEIIEAVNDDAPRKVRFEVVDNGGGIAPENLTRVFSHGFTTKKDGHGFGLHSAANAAREMCGSLNVSSEGQGKGATFTLEIPAIYADEEAVCQN